MSFFRSRHFIGTETFIRIFLISDCRTALLSQKLLNTRQIPRHRHVYIEISARFYGALVSRQLKLAVDFTLQKDTVTEIINFKHVVAVTVLNDCFFSYLVY